MLNSAKAKLKNMNLIVPKTYSENLSFRVAYKKKINSDPVFAEIVREQCKKDILFWINAFCWTHDPRVYPSKLPFITYEFQDKAILEMVDAIQNQHDLLVEKSRDMGVSWSAIYVIQWFWLFHGPGNDFLIGSYKETYVDQRGSLDTIFEKFRYNLKMQPQYFKPKGFIKNEHDKIMSITNPETDSFIKGSTAGAYFGSAGRYKGIIFDEFAKWDFVDEGAWKSASDAAPSKIAISSANGKKNLFYKLRSGEAGEIKRLRLHWSQHPEKTQEWYEKQKIRRSPSDVARELDIDYSESVENKAAHNFDYSVHVKEFDYIPDMPLELNCDFNVNPMCWNISQTLKGTRYTFDEVTEKTTITEEVCNKIITKYAGHRNKIIRVYGDPAGRFGGTRSKHSDYGIILRMFKLAGWTVYLEVATKHPGMTERLNAMNKRLKDWENDYISWEFITPNCVKLIDSLQQTQREGDKILKDGSEHHLDAWSYPLAFKYPIRRYR